MLNKRAELKSRCGHLKKFFLNRLPNFDSNNENHDDCDGENGGGNHDDN